MSLVSSRPYHLTGTHVASSRHTSTTSFSILSPSRDPTAPTDTGSASCNSPDVSPAPTSRFAEWAAAGWRRVRLPRVRPQGRHDPRVGCRGRAPLWPRRASACAHLSRRSTRVGTTEPDLTPLSSVTPPSACALVKRLAFIDNLGDNTLEEALALALERCRPSARGSPDCHRFL